MSELSTSLPTVPLHASLRVLADETRLRILALLARAELSVGEIARCLAMGQSRISNHLRTLREAGLISERHEGSFTFCRLELPIGPMSEVWRAVTPALDGLEHAQADARRLAAVLGDRSASRSFFDRIAGDWDVLGADFRAGTGRLEVLGHLVSPELVVADVGCGTGYLAAALARHVARVICIDASPAMLERTRENLSAAPAEIETREGALEQLPLADGEVDAICAHMVMHHLVDTRRGLSEMVRAVRPGGLIVCVDMLPHHELWMRDAQGDVRLGLEPSALEADLAALGAVHIDHDLLGDDYVAEAPNGRKTEFPLFLVRGRRPHGDDTSAH